MLLGGGLLWASAWALSSPVDFQHPGDWEFIGRIVLLLIGSVVGFAALLLGALPVMADIRRGRKPALISAIAAILGMASVLLSVFFCLVAAWLGGL